MRKYIKVFRDFVNESDSITNNKWELGLDNTKTFVFYTNRGKMYLTGCRQCDEVTPLENIFQDRQMIGNVYQSLCNCAVCGNYVVLDEHRYDDIKSYLDNKEEIDDESAKNIRHSLHINIFTQPMSRNIQPSVVVSCEPHIRGKYEVDKLYVYIKENNTDDLMDNPFNNFYQNSSDAGHIIFDLDKKVVHYPYPESNIKKKYPVEFLEYFEKLKKDYDIR